LYARIHIRVAQTQQANTYPSLAWSVDPDFEAWLADTQEQFPGLVSAGGEPTLELLLYNQPKRFSPTNFGKKSSYFSTLAF
jgi:hypothetical protein